MKKTNTSEKSVSTRKSIISVVAEKNNCSPLYVRLIHQGKRATQSPKARKVQEDLNKFIELALQA